MRIVNDHLEIPKAALQRPSAAGYLLLAAEVDRRPPLLPSSRAKRRLIAFSAAAVADLSRLPGVTGAELFDARLVAPGMGHELLRRRAGTVHQARFDLVVLVETTDPAAAAAVRGHPGYRRLAARVAGAAQHTHEIVARNVRRIADVDHTRPSVFLFNYFYAEDPRDLLPVWEYTAGWFVDKTSLADSTVLEPLDGEADDYGIINHASWPSFTTFLPSLVLRPSFRRYVLANFAANGIAAQPILYRRVAPLPVSRRPGFGGDEAWSDGSSIRLTATTPPIRAKRASSTTTRRHRTRGL